METLIEASNNNWYNFLWMMSPTATFYHLRRDLRHFPEIGRACSSSDLTFHSTCSSSFSHFVLKKNFLSVMTSPCINIVLFCRVKFQASLHLELKIASRHVSLSWGVSKIFSNWSRKSLQYFYLALSIAACNYVLFFLIWPFLNVNML